MSGFLFVLTWVGDCKTYFEECCGAVCRNPCTEKCDVKFLFVFIRVVDRKTNFETSDAAVLMPCIQGWRCRPAARCVDWWTDGMADFVRCQSYRPVDRWNGRFVCV